METGFRLDQKLDPVNQVGIFLGFATHEGVYGSQILTSNHSIVTAKYQVAYDNDLMPLVSSDASNPRMKPLLQLLGRGPTHLKSQGFASNSDCPEGSPETEPNLPLFSTSEEQDQSSDDEYVEQILSTLAGILPSTWSWKSAVICNRLKASRVSGDVKCPVKAKTYFWPQSTIFDSTID